MKKIMILGAGTYQVPLIRTAKKMGLYTIVVSIPGNYPGFSLADKVYELDTKDCEAVLEAARQEQIDGICTSGTDVAVRTIGYVCRELNLCGIPYDAAEIVTDKVRMKEAFLRGNVNVSPGRLASSVKDAILAAEEIGYPLVIKRVDSSGSRGISIVHSESEIASAFAHAIRVSSKDYVLVEGFLTGNEIGVDGFVLDGQLVFLAPHDKFVYQTDKITIPVGHAFPFSCSDTVQREIARQMQLAIDATGINNCSVNADVFIDGETVSIIEIGGRTGATCIPELISSYYGFDFYEKILRNALGEKIDFDHTTQSACMAKLLLCPVDGVITAIDHNRIRSIADAEIVLDYGVGHKVNATVDGTDRIGHVIALTDNVAALDALIEKVSCCIEVNGRPLNTYSLL